MQKKVQNSEKQTKMLKEAYNIINLLTGSLQLPILEQLLNEELIFNKKVILTHYF